MADDIDPIRQAYGPDSLSTADVMAQYRAPQWGGLASMVPPLQPEWMKAAQRYFGQGLAAIPPEAMLALQFLVRTNQGGPIPSAYPEASSPLEAAAQGPKPNRPTYTLSPNLAGSDDVPRTAPAAGVKQGEPFYYHVIRDGEKIGSARGSVGDDTAYLSWLGASGLENTLGANGIRQLIEAMRRDFPEVKEFRGYRLSGARAQGSADKPAADKMQIMKLYK
jgi:hypothetical protein